MSKPFRWDLSRREQLGQLLEADHKQLTPAPEFVTALRETAAKTIAFSGAADLAFIGRSPENIFDYLSGAFDGVAATPKLHLLQFSLRWAGEGGIQAIAAEKRSALFDYFQSEGLAPENLARRPRPLAFVDFVAYGGTLKNLFGLLKLMAERDRVDWTAVQRRLMIIGITTRTKNSPNTWRWQQNQDWLDDIPDTPIKNVSAPGGFTFYIANDQPKVTHSHHPGHWATPRRRDRGPSEEQLRALKHAVQLYDLGQTEPKELAALIAATGGMKDKSVRDLVLALKRK